MKYILLLSTIILLSCNKSSIMSEPLQAIPKATVNGKIITLTSDQSKGDVCAYGFAMSTGSPDGAKVIFSPNSYAEGKKNSDGTFVPGTLKYIPITATVDKNGTYIFSMEVLDKDRNSDWEQFTIEIK